MLQLCRWVIVCVRVYVYMPLVQLFPPPPPFQIDIKTAYSPRWNSRNGTVIRNHRCVLVSNSTISLTQKNASQNPINWLASASIDRSVLHQLCVCVCGLSLTRIKTNKNLNKNVACLEQSYLFITKEQTKWILDDNKC